MMTFIKNFRKDEDGAVTVDWVVLTAAVVGLAVAAYSSIQDGATALTDATETHLGGLEVGNLGGSSEEAAPAPDAPAEGG